MKKNDKRNLHPTIEAQIAMRIYSYEYSHQRGGSMDFWDALSESDKKYIQGIIDIVKKDSPNA